MLQHPVYDLFRDLFLGPDLIPGDQTALIVHIQQGADVQHLTEETGRFRNPAAADEKGQIRGEEPVMQMQLVLLRIMIKLLQGHPLIPQLRQLIHQQTEAGGRGEGIHDENFPVREFPAQLIGSSPGGVHRAGDPGGKDQMHQVLPLFQEGAPEADIFRHIDLAGTAFLAIQHPLIKGVGIHGFPQIIRMAFTAQLIMEADIGHADFPKVFRAQIRRRTGGQYIIIHGSCPFFPDKETNK